MRIFFGWITFCCVMASVAVQAQVRLPKLPDSLFSTYYHQRNTLFALAPAQPGDVVFAGNSITDGGEWAELFADPRMKNRGISGDITAGVLHRLDIMARQRPAKLFLLIGTNDLARGLSTDSVVRNILLMTAYLKQESPATKLFVQSILPVNEAFGKFSGHTSKRDSILKVNQRLGDAAAKYGYSFVNLYPFFCNLQGKLDERFTNDGLHLTGEGYLLWKHLVFPHVYGLQERPSLIPLPQSLVWKDGYFPLYRCTEIVVQDTTLNKEARLLQQMMNEKGWHPVIRQKAGSSAWPVILRLSRKTPSLASEEAYSLHVSPEKIEVVASDPHGIFNGLQTLRQLMRDGVMVDACVITDRPAFGWRGYMIDVGRNYMSLPLLKEQIDVMAAYKLNVFHFHATEDIAWRIAIRQYPQLTAPEHMLRNKGQYYTEAEIKELIAYCRERYITFVPELDMPGHSAAFQRAMKTDMQRDSGLQYVKDILKEFCTTYDVPYIHIGADEVKITNKQFVPEVTAYIESLGKKVIGWQPGGNFSEGTIRQLWMDDNAHLKGGQHIQYIDSRHLYLNHMDPLESVVTIFNRRLADKEQGDSLAMGATLCMWHDRAVGREDDVLRMNPVYPGMLAFAERSWRGGGKTGWIANMDDGDTAAFRHFENRLLDNKTLWFGSKPFPYVQQSHLTWKLLGPYDNGGDLTKSFDIERSLLPGQSVEPAKQVTGGTVVLKHWWAPLIKGALDKPQENSTWYATTQIWSAADTTRDFWIGFNNLSRSSATDSPPAGAWDNKGSAVWVNGRQIAPPAWTRPGQRGHSEIPLIDEGYEYRAPTRIFLQKGWNTVVLKMPIGSFKGKDWQNPVKWMFTFVEKAN